MKKFLILFLFTVVSFQFLFAGNDDPFTVELEALNIPGAPGLHSFTFAKHDNKWLLIGGRTNGLHGMTPSTAFPRTYANRMVYVIDYTTNQVWSRNLFTDLAIQQADPLRTTNLQGIQVGTKLYVCGGFGIDSLIGNYETFPMLTAIDVPQMMNAIINGTSMASSIKQVKDTRVEVCGGDIEYMNEYFYLIGGHDFRGNYIQVGNNDQRYTNSYKKFKIDETSSTISITDYYEHIDTVNLHRRDLNVSPALKPDMTPYIIIYGGVFQYNKDFPFQNPVYMDANGCSVDMSFTQKMNQYHTAHLVMFDSVTGKMYTTLFGGTSLNDYNNGSYERDTLIPFVDDISLLTRNADGSTIEEVLPTKMPGLLGTSSEMIKADNVAMYDNQVLKFKSIQGRTLVGYIYGGIKATLPNGGPSTANDVIYKVFVTPNPVSVENISNEVPEKYFLSQNYPNPFNPVTNIEFKISSSDFVKLKVYDVMGKEVSALVNRNLTPGTYKINFDGSRLTSGMYFYKLETSKFTDVKKMVLIK
jgi:hypothetical protein